MSNDRLTFSQRIGLTPSSRELQLKSMDQELRNRLWNVIKITVLDHALSEYPQSSKFVVSIWHNFFKIPIDSIPYYNSETQKFIQDKFFACQWFEVYDFLEFISSSLNKKSVMYDEFVGHTNLVLQKEFSGYRFIDGILSPITNAIEIEELQSAMAQHEHYTAIKGVNIHLSSALQKLSDRENPDYRNSIKESISAVETICRVLTGQSTLGRSLEVLEKKGITINKQLLDGFNKIYAFTNTSQSGCRHAIMEDHKEPDFDDAKYLLVVCSAFINYLIGKCSSLGIKIQ